MLNFNFQKLRIISGKSTHSVFITNCNVEMKDKMELEAILTIYFLKYFISLFMTDTERRAET